MQVSPSGMAAASQAAPGEFDSRHLLQKEKHPRRVLLFLGDKVITGEWEMSCFTRKIKFYIKYKISIDGAYKKW